ncbi:small, acid-soluble spore protein L [Heyndrickxia coagulans]|uniref:Small, acid-soluble spore protein L n=1 Tax=Heyndrickxia coagulans TaxID=1398 RepID=A0AAW7CEB1_HEYCO|nr:small, acid-soluble spore protein L [Heyndrickxia coagulans]MDL5040589.1 small, acid-soluble spore protein L [Heyndrickxia coagulans]
MAKKDNTNRGKAANSVTPQGIAQDAAFAPDPKTTLENRAKKFNTKI